MARNDGLVHAVLRRQWGGPLTYDEQLQAGRIGLWQAIRRFDPSRGIAFSTYAWPAIAREIWDEVAQANSPPQELLTPSPPLDAPDLDEPLQCAELYACLHHLVDKLPPHLREVVVLYYGLGDRPSHSLRQLARKLDISHEMVRKRLLDGLIQLRQPANSLPLRQLTDHNTVTDYQYADDLAQRFLRYRGGHHVR